MPNLLALIGGWAVIAGAALWGWNLAGDDAAARASILILGATAAVAVWYAYETRRMAGSSSELAEETKRLAGQTERMAEKTAEMANVNRKMLDHQWAMQEISLTLSRRGGSRESARLELLNEGPGLARSVEVRFEAPEEPGRGPFVLDAKENEMFTGVNARRVVVTAQDTIGRHHKYVWSSDETRHHWALAGTWENCDGEMG